jgi:hypothetical protein
MGGSDRYGHVGPGSALAAPMNVKAVTIIRVTTREVI